MPTLYLEFIRGEGTIAEIIRALKPNPANPIATPAHCRVGLVLDSAIPGSYGVEAIISGVHAGEFDERGLIARVHLSVTDNQYDQAWEFLEEQLHKPYDFWALILDVLFPFVRYLPRYTLYDRTRTHWDCSRLLGSLLRTIGYPLSENDRDPVWPVDVLEQALRYPGTTVDWYRFIP